MLFTQAGCATPREAPPADSMRAQAPAAAPSTISSASTPAVATPMTVTEHGLGALRAGMTVGEANAVLNGALSVVASRDSMGCNYATWKGAPEGVSIMTDGGRIARVEVRSGTMQTSDGARIGDTEERIKALYAGRIMVQPSKYSSGHYLVVTPTVPADSAFRIVFETEKNVVTKYRAGTRPQVEYVEGCG
ncbi:MAG: hypothetical protein JWM95_5638 [Gemmatimonadetes bacterium]|nr:hypothetical protein [Gemmatimonadota bacterium]